MLIGLDARCLFMPRLRGTGRNLSDAFKLVPVLRPDWRFVLYHQRPGAAPLPGHPNVRTRRIDIPGDRFDAWLQVRLPLAALSDRLDVLHLPANAAPARCSVPYIVTIHDLVPLKIEDETPPRQRRAFERGVQRAVRGATQIITPSAATRDELIGEFDVPTERITVIPWAADRAMDRVNPSAAAELAERYRLRDEWLLNFSGESRRKNAIGLLEAYAHTPLELRSRHQLVLVGCEPAAFREALERRARELEVYHECRFLGFVPHEELPGLLSGARALLMPSLCEGFGLPILDAFACGTPVMTSNVSSMPEVAGDAAMYCDPRDADSIAAAIVEITNDACAADLSAKGELRVRTFRWERTAEAMCGVYERARAETLSARVRERVTGVSR